MIPHAGQYIAIPKGKGRYRLGVVVAVDKDEVAYRHVRTIPLSQEVHIAKLAHILPLRLAVMNVKLLLNTEVLVMNNGFWRKGLLLDRFPDSGLYEIKYRNGKTITARAKDVYHVLF